MKNLLIKIAYKILQHYGMEDLPILYFNGTRYYVKSCEYHHPTEINQNDSLYIMAEDKE